MLKTLVIIPAFNEAENLRILLPRLKQEAAAIQADILAIDDASSDATLEILQENEIKSISHIIQMGYGTTIQTGYKYALRNHYDCVIQLDGDAQHDPRFLPLFCMN